MDMVERVARALCRNDCESDPDELLGNIAGDDRTFVWELYVDDAKAAVRAMLDGQEPVAWRYFIKSPEAGMGKTLLRTSRDPHLVDDGWTETPLYDLSALKEAVK